MADVTITPTRLTPGTEGTAHDGGTSITTGQTFSVACGGDFRGLFFEIYDSGGSASVVTIDAGDYPGAPLKFKGADTITNTASKSKPYVPEKGRHNKADGTIAGSNTGGTIKMLAYWLPLGY